jgi:superfamily II DNA or RNA helicase
MSEEWRSAIKGAWFYVPREAIGDDKAIENLKQKLTVVSPFAEREEQVMHLFTERLPGYLGVPRYFGQQHWADLSIDDRTVGGFPLTAVTKRPDPNHPMVLDPAAQAKFMRDIYEAMVSFKQVLCEAPTGSGKTVSFLDAAAEYGRTTLILVHLERLMGQWVEEIHSKLGVPYSKIGQIQQGKCQFAGMDFGVGLLHSVVRRQYPSDFYRYWGVAAFDEVHKMGSPFFSKAIGKFPAAVTVGLSATMKRKDRTERVFMHHLGPVRVKSTAAALPMTVHVMRHVNRGPLWGVEHGAVMQCLSRNQYRNAFLVGIIKRFYETGRQALIVGESVEHLQRLMEMSKEIGIPSSVMGQYTAQTNSYVEVVEKGRRRRKIVKSKASASDLDDVKANAQLIFATYGMLTEGIDIPRLDAGLDATPRGQATQIIGRIRRPMPGKKHPIWVTVLDVHVKLCTRYFQKRLKDYIASGGVEVVGKGIDYVTANTSTRSQGPASHWQKDMVGQAQRAQAEALPH